MAGLRGGSRPGDRESTGIAPELYSQRVALFSGGTRGERRYRRRERARASRQTTQPSYFTATESCRLDRLSDWSEPFQGVPPSSPALGFVEHQPGDEPFPLTPSRDSRRHRQSRMMRPMRPAWASGTPLDCMGDGARGGIKGFIIRPIRYGTATVTYRTNTNTRTAAATSTRMRWVS